MLCLTGTSTPVSPKNSIDGIVANVVVFGNHTSGQSSIINRLCFNRFFSRHTIKTTVSKMQNDKHIQLNVYDATGMTSLDFIQQNIVLIKKCNCVFICFDVLLGDWPSQLHNWISFVQFSNPNANIALLCTKLDVKKLDENDIDIIDEVKTLYKIKHFIQCSAKTGENFDVIKQILQSYVGIE